MRRRVVGSPNRPGANWPVAPSGANTDRRLRPGGEQQLAPQLDPLPQGRPAGAGVDHRREHLGLTGRDDQPIDAVVAVPFGGQAVDVGESGDGGLLAVACWCSRAASSTPIEAPSVTDSFSLGCNGSGSTIWPGPPLLSKVASMMLSSLAR